MIDLASVRVYLEDRLKELHDLIIQLKETEQNLLQYKTTVVNDVTIAAWHNIVRDNVLNYRFLSDLLENLKEY